MGSIDKGFMDLPPEVLTTSMRYHQKYFSLLDAKGNLAPRFMVVAATRADDKGAAIIAGNERVIPTMMEGLFEPLSKQKPLSQPATGPANVSLCYHPNIGLN